MQSCTNGPTRKASKREVSGTMAPLCASQRTSFDGIFGFDPEVLYRLSRRRSCTFQAAWVEYRCTSKRFRPIIKKKKRKRNVTQLLQTHIILQWSSETLKKLSIVNRLGIKTHFSFVFFYSPSTGLKTKLIQDRRRLTEVFRQHRRRYLLLLSSCIYECSRNTSLWVNADTNASVMLQTLLLSLFQNPQKTLIFRQMAFLTI